MSRIDWGRRSGEEDVVELVINTLSQAPGPQSWNVRLHYRSEGISKELTLQLRARLIREVLVEPAARNTGPVS